MKIKYNAPVVLTFALISVAVLLVSDFLMSDFKALFTVGGQFGSYSNPIEYFRLVSHIAGHQNWAHLMGNFSFILLIGPILEEKYGSKKLLVMILLTGLLTGIVNIILFDSGLLGASGIVFMMIVLASISNVKDGAIPLTFILVTALYIGTEVINSLDVTDNVSQFAHIFGGICGGIFGFTARN